MKGISPYREQGYKDPLLVQVMKAHGLSELPLYKSRPPEQNELRKRWADLAPLRDGPVSPDRFTFESPDAAAREIRQLAKSLGAADVGIARLTPIMVREGVELGHDFVICMIFVEDYAATLDGARETETEAARAYLKCAQSSTELAAHLRSLGYGATAHHNGGCDVQAIAAMHAGGLGELGKHGSLIHPIYGASHRPGIVTTSLELATDRPVEFGVQERCATCMLCTNNCPGDAIPAEAFIMTEGVKRWLTDVAKCYEYSRLREQYCHICVDVCPYVHLENGDDKMKGLYKRYMMKRKKAGYKTPTWWAEDEERVLDGKG
ncbi:MAG: hypothetical protein RLZ98_2175 [Pseudomonadota bacterium]